MAVAASPLRLTPRQPDRRTEAAELRIELDAHRTEALAFCAAVRPLASRLTLAMREIGPTGHQLAIQLEALLARYERRHQPEGDEPVAVAA